MCKKISMAFLVMGIFIFGDVSAAICDDTYSDLPFYNVRLHDGFEVICNYQNESGIGYYYGTTHDGYIISGSWKSIGNGYYVCSDNAENCVFGIKNIK